MRKITLVSLGLFLAAGRLAAQTIDASPETQTICAGGNATLTAVVTPGAGTGSLPTNSYAISSIPYAPDPYNTGTFITLSDDSQSGILPIGFTFCFFGQNYTDFRIGSNGWVAFSAQPTTFTSVSIPNTGATVPKNCIMGPWQDWHPGIAGGPYINYQTLGTAPFRRLVVSWNNCPMFSCTTTLGTFQITIYETTNIIENHILNKPACLAWAGGTAVQGLHNPAGTVAFTVPGRNSTPWIANNEGWRYTPNGTPNYQINWYILPANVLIGTGSPIVVTPPTSPQYYYAEVVDLNACPSGLPTNKDTVEVLSNTVTVDAGAFTSICPGNSTTLGATSGTAIGYSWSPAGSLSNPSISNPVATPGASTTYTVTANDAMGCLGTDTVTVAVAPIVANAGTNVAICIGSSTTLNATGGSSYSWSPATGLSNPSISNPIANPTATTSYTVTATQGVCTATSIVTVTVNPLPVVDAGAAVSICNGSTTTLSATGATGYVWSPAGTLSSSTISNPVSSATSTTTYTVVGTDGNGCSSTDAVTVTVNPLPVIDAGAPVTICPGFSTTLGASGATNYLWTPGASLSNPNIANPVATPGSTTTYSVTGTDGNGCTSTDAVTVTVAPLTVTATAGGFGICNGSSTTLNAGGGASSFVWSPGATLSSTTIANPVATPVGTTTYTVVGTSSLGCTASATVTVFVFPLPNVNASSNTAICSGTTTSLSVTGASSYIWTPSSSLSSATVSNPVSSATATTTYTVTGTDANGCTNTDVVTVTVNPLPVIDAGTSMSICPGSSTTLNGTGGVSYVWSPAASLDNPSIANPVATPSTATNYTVTGTDANGCTGTDNVLINVSGITVTAGTLGSSICSGSTTVLGATGASSYVWSPAGSLSSATAPNPVASPTSTTTYTVVGTSAGCTNSSTVTITVTPLPTISAGSPVAICSGSTTGLTATGGSTYSWSPAGSLTGSTTATPTSSATTTTTYTVVGTSGGCSSTSTVTVTVNSLPAASAGSAANICTGSSTTLSGSGGVSYSWSPAATLSSATSASPVATPAATTTYTVVVTNASGCTATSAVTVTVNPIPTATASSNVTICSGASTVLTAGGGGTYSWSPSTGLSSTTAANPTATPATTTTYVVTVSNGFCSNTASVTVTVNNTMSIAPSTTTDATCGNVDGSITAGAVTGGGSPFMYTLNGGSPQSSSTFSGIASGNYLLTVTDAAGCSTSDSVTVNSVLGVNAAFSASPTSGSSPLTVNLTNTSNGASNYIWDFGDGSGSLSTSPSTIYGANGSYTITLVAYNGSLACADTTTINIEVFDAAMMLVPNVFTPNGDLDNDLFVPITVGMKTVTGTIYNRWGNKIAEWSGAPTLGWNGTHNGKPSEDGTYYYVIKATGFDDKEYDAAGYVQLLSTK